MLQDDPGTGTSDAVGFSSRARASFSVIGAPRLGVHREPTEKHTPIEAERATAAQAVSCVRGGYLYRITKRLVDVSISLLVLLLTWPLMLYIAAYIRRHSQGPVIFRQVRVKKTRRKSSAKRYYLDASAGELRMDRRSGGGEHRRVPTDRRREAMLYFQCPKTGKMIRDRRKMDLGGEPFVFYKFRSMFAEARERFPELYQYKYTDEEIRRIYFKKEDDPRVPVWAKWLRRSSLDELPNFINVLRGDMSLVGPRPDIPEMIRYYSPQQRAKLSVKPGITGLAQVAGRGHLSFQETLKHDLQYVQSCSLLLDCKVLIETALATIFGNGAF